MRFRRWFRFDTYVGGTCFSTPCRYSNMIEDIKHTTYPYLIKELTAILRVQEWASDIT